MSTGYANRVVRFDFPDLSEDPQNDPIWVIVRNPKTLPQEELLSAYDGGGFKDGQIVDREAANSSTRKLSAKLVIAARVYDATAEPEFDPLTGEITGGADQPLLPKPPWTPEIAAKLPTEITRKITELVAESLNPQRAPTQKTSSG